MAKPLEVLALRLSGKVSSGPCLKDILLSKTCASLVELRLEAAWESATDVEEAVGAYLRATGAPSLRRLSLVNIGEDSSESTEIALALQNGSAPLLETLRLNYVMQRNSMSILVDAVAQNGLFAGLRVLGLASEGGMLDLSPLFQAITAGHKCPVLESLDVYCASRSIVALGDALVAGAFPALTELSTPELDEEEEADVIGFILVLEGREVPLVKLELRTRGLSRAVYVVLANALFTPAFASLRELIVWDLPSVSFDPLFGAFEAGAGIQLQDLCFGDFNDEIMDEYMVSQVHEALKKEDILPKLRYVNYLGDGEAAALLQTFLDEKIDYDQ
jgi:hypothetical protein